MTTDTIHRAHRTILRVDASGRKDDSTTRALCEALIARLGETFELSLTQRDLAAGVPLVDEAWIAANFTPEAERDDDQRAVLALSDALVSELRAADIVVIGAPIYNFGVPASLKAWIDMIARARLTFRYTTEGPVGLLSGKKAYLVMASGGVTLDSSVDFATPYLRHALAVLGITDVDVVAAERTNVESEAALARAQAQIDALNPEFTRAA